MYFLKNMSFIQGLTFCKNFAHLGGVSCIFALSSGGLYSTAPLVFNESYPASVPSAIGLSSLLRAIVAILFGPLLGNNNFKVQRVVKIRAVEALIP